MIIQIVDTRCVLLCFELVRFWLSLACSEVRPGPVGFGVFYEAVSFFLLCSSSLFLFLFYVYIFNNDIIKPTQTNINAYVTVQ